METVDVKGDLLVVHVAQWYSFENNDRQCNGKRIPSKIEIGGSTATHTKAMSG